MPCSCETKPEGCQCGTSCTCGDSHPAPKPKAHPESCSCGDKCECGATSECDNKK